MNRRFILLTAVCALGSALAFPLHAQEPAAKNSPPAQAKQLLEEGRTKAKKQHKAIMVLFDASW